MDQPNSVAASDANECPACSFAQNSGARFCPQCGNPVADPQDASATPTPQPGIPAPAAPPAAQPDADTADQPEAPAVAAPAPQVDPQAQPLMCACGQALPGNAQFCLRCGQKLAQPSPSYALVCKDKAGQDQHVPIQGAELTIGKSQDCGLALPDDEYVSRHHAKITVNDGQLALEDVGSANGTFLRVRRPTPIQPGDEILMGTTVVQLEGPVS